MNRFIRPLTFISSCSRRSHIRVPVTRWTSVRSLSYLREMPVDTTEALRKSLLWRSKQRGLLELDIVIGSFAEKYIHQMTPVQLKEYEQLIALESPDLWRYLHDPTTIIPPHVSNMSLFQSLQQYMTSQAWKKESNESDIETLRKSLVRRSKQRGLRELDIVLGSFAEKNIHQMTLQQLKDYEHIISVESPHLWSYLQDPKVIIPDDIKTLSSFHNIKDHMMSMQWKKIHHVTPQSQVEATEALRKSLLWRSKQRGILELDLLVGSFATKYVPTMSLSELKEFQRLIALESPDLLKYLQDPKAIIPDEISTLPMFTSLKKHMMNAHQSFEKNIMTGYARQQGNQ